jgi:hypothetical protein
MQLNVRQQSERIFFIGMESEAIMPEPVQSDSSAIQPIATEVARTNKSVLEFVFGTQNMLLDELVFAGNEILDRTRTETHLFSEFISKMAESHSVKDLRTMFEECSRHQIDFLRRDSERLFRHGDRFLEAVSNLLANRLRS